MSVAAISGFKETAVGWIPETWKCVPQSEVVTFHNGRAYKLTEWETEGTPVIRLQNLTGSGNNYFYSNLKLPPHQYVSKGDLLFMWSATFGPHIWQGEKAIYHYHIWKIDCSERVDRSYMFHSLSRFTEEMKNKTNGSTMLHLTKAGMEKEVIALPPLPEQQKIAAILTAVDEKLDVIARQIEATQTLKQGLMQTLFSRGVGTQDANGRWMPHIEFKDSELGKIPVGKQGHQAIAAGWIPRKWIVSKLSALVDVTYGKSPADIQKLEDGIPIFGTGGITGYTDVALYDGPSIILGRKGTIDKVQRCDSPFWAIDTTFYTAPKETFDWAWLYYVMSAFDLRKLNEASGVPSISRGSLEALDLAIPPLPEQQKIAAILTAVDNKLDVLTSRQTHYQTLKRGLMQKLLTGEWRVKLDREASHGD